MMNPLAISKGKALAFLIFLSLFIVQGCRKDIIQPNSGVLKNSLSIAEAKAYFDANLRQGTKPEKLMSTSEVGNGVTADNYLTNKQPIWNQTYQKMLANGNSVKMPIDFGNAYAVVNEAKNELMPLSALNYLFMYKDSLQVIHAEWVMLLPDSALASRKQK
ncbi:hypothetical protein ACFOG5_16835 [Pedobacter fastidiosus]|uniref:Uncharacterized protein n=1 Tax=Pedobacter fastidiosus TaxID=2765361 RepID=A0ABR7KRL5_9SPHI|nr:hypothetical protein [Pedobacter fastidiosus]MBC6110741.1 hypothetical protein [Pedobacter fastidiosus]